MDLLKRNQLIEAYISKGGIPGFSRITEEQVATLTEISRDYEARITPGMNVRPTDDGKILDFSDFMSVWDHYFPKRTVNIGSLFVFPERYADMSTSDTIKELLWYNHLHEQIFVKTISVQEFFDGNTDERSVSPFPTTCDFVSWREIMLGLANREDVKAVGLLQQAL